MVSHHTIRMGLFSPFCVQSPSAWANLVTKHSMCAYMHNQLMILLACWLSIEISGTYVFLVNPLTVSGQI